jgi:hypothetical protein
MSEIEDVPPTQTFRDEQVNLETIFTPPPNPLPKNWGGGVIDHGVFLSGFAAQKYPKNPFSPFSPWDAKRFLHPKGAGGLRVPPPGTPTKAASR